MRDAPSPVLLVPGNWVARTITGSAVACCERIAQLHDQLKELGIDERAVSLQKLPMPDEALFLGGMEAEII